MRENAETKARRYLCEARLNIFEVSTETIAALCRGDGVVYELGWNHADEWHCTCRAMTPKCAHLLALRLGCIATTTRTEADT